MAMSDCEKCWDTPCTCGYYYRDHSVEQMSKHICSIVTGHRDRVSTVKVIQSVLSALNERGYYFMLDERKHFQMLAERLESRIKTNEEWMEQITENDDVMICTELKVLCETTIRSTAKERLLPFVEKISYSWNDDPNKRKVSIYVPSRFNSLEELLKEAGLQKKEN